MQQQPLDFEQSKLVSRQIASTDACNEIIRKFDHNLVPVLQKTDPVEALRQGHVLEQTTYRSVLAHNININDVLFLKDNVLSANSHLFKFNLYDDKIDCFFAKYEVGMHYAQLHIDCIAGPLQRKLSFSLMLNDEYVGGNFELLQPPGPASETGKLLVFPSYLPHKVTPVTQGVRYVIFGWVYGPPYV